jgi:hypothetical protein
VSAADAGRSPEANLGAAMLWPGRWSAEDGGPTRRQSVSAPAGLNIAAGETLALAAHRDAYVTTMRGAALGTGSVRLIRVSAADCSDHEIVEVSRLSRGAVTDPPLYDAERRIAVGYDSANGVVQAFRFEKRLLPLWRRELDHAAHMVFFPASGELVMHHFRSGRFARTGLARTLGRASAGLARSAAVRRAMASRTADEVVVLDIETGAERARCPVPSMSQSVLFPAPGFERDLYWCTFSTLARLRVVPR